MITLADAAPSGAGLAIVGAILLVVFALFAGSIVLVVVLLARRSRRRKAGPPAPGWPGAAPTPPESPASD